MNCSIRTKTSVLAAAVLAIALISSQTAHATELTGSPDIVVASPAPAESSDLIATRRERDAAASRDPQAERARRGDGLSTEVVASPRRAALPRVTKQKTARFREAATPSWPYSGRWRAGLILGVGF
jgi:hypothetical protein